MEDVHLSQNRQPTTMIRQIELNCIDFNVEQRIISLSVELDTSKIEFMMISVTIYDDDDDVKMLKAIRLSHFDVDRELFCPSSPSKEWRMIK